MASGHIQRDPSARSDLGLLERAGPYEVVAIASWPKPRACSLNFLNLDLEEQMRRQRIRQSAAASVWFDDGAVA